MTIDVNPIDVRGIEVSELLELFSDLSEYEKEEFLEKTKHELKDKEAIKNKIRQFPADEAHEFVKELSKEFLSLDEIHQKLAQINKENK